MIIVTRAIVLQNNCILAAQRPESMSLPLKWELPGGKVEPEELLEDCLVRETFEELMLHVRPVEKLAFLDREFKGKHYRMVPFLCEQIGGKMKVVEHAQAVWQPIAELFELDWAPTEKAILENFIASHKPATLGASLA